MSLLKNLFWPNHKYAHQSKYSYLRFYNDGKHGIQTRRVIWDISVIAYLINKEWFEISQINCPNIKEDTSYELNTNNRLITMVDFIDSDKIYEDMFEKLGEKNEINEWNCNKNIRRCKR